MSFHRPFRLTVMDVHNLADLYELPPVDWAAIQARLDRGLTLARDPRCAISVSTDEFDLVVEGTAQ